MGLQNGWRWCRRCQVLVFAGFGNGTCWDGEPHYLNDSDDYSLMKDDEPEDLQHGWRWCSRCQVLGFSGFNNGICWDEKPHYFGDSGAYSLSLTDTVPPRSQGGWRWCSRCQALVYSGFDEGICSNGQPHDLSNSGPYNVLKGVQPGEIPTKQVRIKLLRYLWQAPTRAAAGHLVWPDAAYAEIFRAPNGWSLHDYWWRCTLGLIDAQFDFEPWHVLRWSQDELMNDRRAIARAARQQASDDGISLAGYGHVFVVVHAPPCNAGATGIGADVVVDQNPFTLGFFQHEVGHLLGFEHAFGPGGAYDDSYCVMGWSRAQEHAIPKPALFDDVFMLPGVDLFRSERRLSAAALYRSVEEFRSSSSTVRVDILDPATVTLVALSEARFGDPVLAVVGTPNGEVTVEYRAATGDDAGVSPAVVVHSIGRRTLPSGAAEVNPTWLETIIPTTVGAAAQIDDDVKVTVADAPDGGRRIAVRLERP
jgi:hypothetical protein